MSATRAALELLANHLRDARDAGAWADVERYERDIDELLATYWRELHPKLNPATAGT